MLDGWIDKYVLRERETQKIIFKGCKVICKPRFEKVKEQRICKAEEEDPRSKKLGLRAGPVY